MSYDRNQSNTSRGVNYVLHACGEAGSTIRQNLKDANELEGNPHQVSFSSLKQVFLPNVTPLLGAIHAPNPMVAYHAKALVAAIARSEDFTEETAIISERLVFAMDEPEDSLRSLRR